MRNLKRALSLTLASVMLLGMMVVGAGAASYPDVDDNDNVEAIDVLNAVEVMIGRQGNFEPDEAVNRHEMAVIMAPTPSPTLCLGPTSTWPPAMRTDSWPAPAPPPSAAASP